MSLQFDAAAEKASAVFSSTYTFPITLAVIMKTTAHPVDFCNILGLGTYVDDDTDSIYTRTLSTDNQYSCRYQAPNDTGSTPVGKNRNNDGVWVGFLCVFGAANSRKVYLYDSASPSVDTNTVQASGGAWKYVTVGQLANGGAHLGEAMAALGGGAYARISEIAIWNVSLTEAEITDYMGGTSADQIQSPIGYWKLNSDSVVYENLGSDSLGTLSYVGASYSSDHPDIDYGVVGGTVTPNVSYVSV